MRLHVQCVKTWPLRSTRTRILRIDSDCRQSRARGSQLLVQLRPRAAVVTSELYADGPVTLSTHETALLHTVLFVTPRIASH